MDIFNKITELLIGKPKEDQKMYKTIHPYYLTDSWVFDDHETGLEEEALVDGIDTMLDEICDKLCILPAYGLDVHFANHREAFEDTPYTTKIILELISECPGGWKTAGANYKVAVTAFVEDRLYDEDQKKHLIPLVKTGTVGWLCSNLAKYFDELPQHIYIAFQDDIIPELQKEAKEHDFEIKVAEEYYTYDDEEDEERRLSEREAYWIMQKLHKFPKWKLENVQLAHYTASQQPWIKNILNKAQNLDKTKIHLVHKNPHPVGHNTVLIIKMRMPDEGCRPVDYPWLS